jgi:two-component system response regulator
MKRRPRTVSGSAAPGLIGAPLVPTVLLADADEAASAMLRDALLEGTGPCDLRAVHDGGALHDYLHRRNGFEDPATAPRPSLVIVDSDLPETGALDAVRAMKSNDDLRRIPVVVLASRLEPEGVAAAYDAGANTLIAKPVTFLALVKLMKVFTAYWLDAAVLPPEDA